MIRSRPCLGGGDADCGGDALQGYEHARSFEAQRHATHAGKTRAFAVRRTTVRWIAAREVGHFSEYRRLLTAELEALGFSLETQPFDDHAVDFYAELDDHWTKFAAAALRSLVTGRRTVGLFFRPGNCFRWDKLRAPFKRLVFSVLSRLPGTSVLIILPYDIDRRFASVSTDWLYDPQLWDLQFFGLPPEDAFPEIDRQIAEAAQGREIVLSLGQAELRKGFDYFCELWSDSEALRSRYLLVAAGRVDAEAKSAAARFAAAGGLLIDRRLEEAELRHLYRRAALIWSCYNPNHDQASGILGRAVQLGVPVIVRARSYLEKLTQHLEHPAVVIPFRQSAAAAEALLAWRPVAIDQEAVTARCLMMRKRSLDVLAKHLGGNSSASTVPVFPR